jgi:hypothetical protein
MMHSFLYVKQACFRRWIKGKDKKSPLERGKGDMKVRSAVHGAEGCVPDMDTVPCLTHP